MQCREACGACCIAPSIVQGFHGMPDGKAAGEACVHLGADMRCALFGDPRRPALCEAFMPEPAICGDNAEQALSNLRRLDAYSAPAGWRS